MVDGTNDIQLADTHFKLREFANASGLVMVHPLLLKRLESLRAALNRCFSVIPGMGREVQVVITDGIRTQEDLELLADKYGWIDEGGKVARDSKHLTKYGGIAADITASLVLLDGGRVQRVPQNVVAREARPLFPYVKDDYADGHVHVDCWDRQKGGVA